MAKKKKRVRGQVQKRGKQRYLIRVPLGDDPITGKRTYWSKTVYGTEQQAEAELVAQLHNQSTGKLVKRTRQKIGEYLMKFLKESLAHEVRPRTLESYVWLAERYLLPTIGEVKMESLTTEQIEGVYRTMTEGGLGSRTVRLVHCVLHNCLEQAVSRGHLSTNPARPARKPREQMKEARALTQAECTRLFDAAKGTRFEALWQLLVTGGVRPGEALALRWSDLVGEELLVRRSLSKLADGRFVFDKTKTNKGRSVPLPGSTLAALRSHRANQSEDRLRTGPAWEENDLMFCTHVGAPLEWRVVSRRYFRPLLKSAGLTGVRPYDLRHTCATLLMLAGVNPKVVQERLGHSTIDITLNTYSHVTPTMQRNATDELERLLFATGAKG